MTHTIEVENIKCGGCLIGIESDSDIEPFTQSLLKKAKSYVSCAVGNLKS